MKVVLKYCFLFFIVVSLLSCHRGVDNLPLLSQITFKAIKDNKFSEIMKVLPDKEDMNSYLEQFEINQYKDNEKRKIESGSRVKMINTRIKDQIGLIHNSPKINWADAILKNYQYEENDTKYGYMEGIGKIEVKSATGTKYIKFQARKVNGLWFLYDSIELLD